MSDMTREEIVTHLAYLDNQIDELKKQRSTFQRLKDRLDFPGDDHRIGSMYDQETGRVKVLCRTCDFETPWLRVDLGSSEIGHIVYDHKRDPSLPWSEDGVLVDDD